MRDWEGEYLPIKLFFSIYKFKKFNKTSYCNNYIISVLPVCDIERRGTALYFARQEREIHIIRGYKERGVYKLANEKLKLIKLIVGEDLSSKSHGIVGLWTRFSYKDKIISAFVDIFNQNLKIFSASYN